MNIAVRAAPTSPRQMRTHRARQVLGEYRPPPVTSGCSQAQMLDGWLSDYCGNAPWARQRD
jgi:hypothetical protein